MSPRVRLECVVPLLRVKDAEAACAYYCERLGFTKDWEHRFEPGLPRYVSLSRDGVALHLSEHEDDGPTEARAYVYVSDPHALHAELHERGAHIVAGPSEQPYGVVELIVEDLDGNRLRFGRATERG